MKENKNLKCSPFLVWIFVLLAGAILVVLVFKTGIIVGLTSIPAKSYSSSCMANNYHSNYNKNISGKFNGWKKAPHFSYKEVVRLIDSGFVVISTGGKEQTVYVNDDTVIIEGNQKGNISLGDNLYVVGDLQENGDIIAGMIKILDLDTKKFGKFW